MGRITANDRIWDIIDRCREWNIKNFGDFYGDKLVEVSDGVTAVYSEHNKNKYVNGTVEFGDISVTYDVNYGTFKVEGVTSGNKFVEFGREVLLKVFG